MTPAMGSTAAKAGIQSDSNGDGYQASKQVAERRTFGKAAEAVMAEEIDSIGKGHNRYRVEPDDWTS